MTFGQRLAHAWNAFRNRDPTQVWDMGLSSSIRPDRPRLTMGNEQSIVNAIYNRIAIDVAAVVIQHVKLDENGRYLETMESGLNEALTVSANIDQTGREFFQDVVISMFDEGHVAIVPTDTTFDPTVSNSYDIKSLRVGRVLQWWPEKVQIRLYNDRAGYKEDIVLPKKNVAIVENPLYSVINEPNSVVARLIRKLNLLDAIDEQSGSGKLDLIIQLPYVIKTLAKEEHAEKRRQDIERQLSGSKYGIAYTDGTERITQLNRPTENNMMTQITYLTTLLYSQLGLADSVFAGTASEQEMLNYFGRTIEPILSAIVEEMKRKFLTKTARTQGQTIMFFRDPFKLVPLANIAEVADTFTRNEILSSNEVRAIIGYKPSKEARANELSNKNLATDQSALPNPQPKKLEPIKNEEEGEVQNGSKM